MVHQNKVDYFRVSTLMALIFSRSQCCIHTPRAIHNTPLALILILITCIELADANKFRPPSFFAGDPRGCPFEPPLGKQVWSDDACASMKAAVLTERVSKRYNVQRDNISPRANKPQTLQLTNFMREVNLCLCRGR